MHITHGIFAWGRWEAWAFRFAGSPMGTSALAWEAWISWDSLHFLSRFVSPDDRFLSPGDLRNLRSCPGSRYPFLITSQIETLIRWPGLYSLLLISSS